MEAAKSQRVAPVSGVGVGEAKQGAAPSSQQVARFSAGLRKLGKPNSHERLPEWGPDAKKGQGREGLEQPLLQKD